MLLKVLCCLPAAGFVPGNKKLGHMAAECYVCRCAYAENFPYLKSLLNRPSEKQRKQATNTS